MFLFFTSSSSDVRGDDGLDLWDIAGGKVIGGLCPSALLLKEGDGISKSSAIAYFLYASSFVSSISVLPKDGPKITGGKDRYSVGDTVNVNCTSKASKPAADIQWIINGKAVRINMKIQD